jgi:tRNA A-37 threonylcarbamoyl transferase component Bud32/tetratricopeptide (TPR) repeat protein
MQVKRSRRAPRLDPTWTLFSTAANRSRDSLDAALSHQREDWLKGIRTPIADRLRAYPALCADSTKAAELIYHEFLLRRDAGETPEWDGLLRQFPEYAVHLRLFREADEIVEGAIGLSGRSATQLGGYELLEEVGRGGMGVVYRAREHNLERIVAIKRIRGGALADDDAIQRFLKEARAVSRLNHPNIVHVYCVGNHKGEPFIALEFVEGSTLGERIGGTPLAPRLAGTIAAAVARAIQHAHEHGIIHRDLKPANILLSGAPDGLSPKVTDFGAAKELENATDREHTHFLGTPSYMAPEQVEPKWGAISQPTDVYGIGALLYEALTGRPPFRADSIGETLRQVIETEPVSPRLLNPAVPRDLETVCLKCLQKEPERRYDSSAALAEDLERFLAGQPIHARPFGPVARGWMWCRRKPGTASLVAVLLLALLGGIGGIIDQWRKAEVARRGALASDVEAQELLSELIQSNPVVPGRGYRPVPPSIDSLLKTEAHCKNLLRKNPDEFTLRIALTKVYGRLGTLYGERGQKAEADANFQQARVLWEPLANEVAGTPDCRDWLATTYTWQDRQDIPRYFKSLQRADAIWQNLADEQPGNLDFMHKLWECRLQITGYIGDGLVRGDCLPLLEQNRTELDQLVRQNPADRGLRRRLALTCFLLGEIYALNPSTGKASSSWRESYEHYNLLAEGCRDDLLGNILLAISCSRLIRAQPTDPYYLQAVLLLEQAGRRLNALVKQEPQSDWLRELLLEDYCYLALCHAKTGQTARAEQAANDRVCVLATPLAAERIAPEFALERAVTLLAFGQLLREAKQPAPSLRLARQAAAVSSELAVYPSHHPGFLYDLGRLLLDCSALANQLGEPTLSLQQAELGRRTIEEWIRTAPDGVRHEDWLSAVWMRIAKARWGLGEREQALAAFRESTAIQKRLFERVPTNHAYRVWLSQCYDRLVFYGSQRGALRGAADAILERTRLWPDNGNQLAKSADDFSSLAEQVTARTCGHLSPENQAERDRYLTESRRIRQAAEAASRRAGHDLSAQR